MAILGLVSASLTATSPQAANAVVSVPTTRWAPVTDSWYSNDTVAGQSGSVTTPCSEANGAYSNLKTYNASGQLVRELSATQAVDSIPNCIRSVAVDRNDDIYGVPGGWNSNHTSWLTNPNLVAFHGSAVKWKYTHGCSYGVVPVVGADGNVYFTTSGRLIGLSSEIAPPLTQPAKVMDIPVPASCGDLVRAFDDGLAVFKNGTVTFITYQGKILGGPTGSYYAGNANEVNQFGHVFYPTYVGSGSTAGIKVTAYSGFRKQVMWTAIESTFGQGGVQYISTNPTVDGGAVVAVKRPITLGSTELQAVLVKLNQFGQKVWEKALANLDATGNRFQPYVTVEVDDRNNITFVRSGSMKTNDPNTTTTPGISIGVLDGNGAVLYDKMMQGNLNKADGPVSGYSVSYATYVRPALAPDTLYLRATCEGSCQIYHETKLYPISIPGLNLAYPRTAVLSRPSRTPAPYVALGDSYSAGEGVAPFDAATDTSTDQCHRSFFAYAQLVSDSPEVNASLADGGFWACSGAKTENIKDTPFKTEAAQSTRLNSNTKLVSISVGGNDMGFTPFGIACVFDTCAQGTTAYNTAMNQLQTVVPNALTSTYVKLLETAKNAKIYVLDYPQVTPADKQYGDPRDPRCSWLADLDQFGIPTWADARAAQEIVTQLDNAIRDAVVAVRAIKPDYAARLQYVPVNNSGSPFAGHTMCADLGESYFNNLDTVVGHESWVLHPNQRGQQAYAQILKGAMSQ